VKTETEVRQMLAIIKAFSYPAPAVEALEWVLDLNPVATDQPQKSPADA
jgi:hypothetical protein